MARLKSCQPRPQKRANPISELPQYSQKPDQLGGTYKPLITRAFFRRVIMPPSLANYVAPAAAVLWHPARPCLASIYLSRYCDVWRAVSFAYLRSDYDVHIKRLDSQIRSIYTRAKCCTSSTFCRLGQTLDRSGESETQIVLVNGRLLIFCPESIVRLQPEQLQSRLAGLIFRRPYV